MLYNRFMQFADTFENKNETSFVTVTIQWSEIDKSKEETLLKIQKDFESEGFRKGKVPVKVVREKVGESKLLEEASRHFLSDVYSQIIKKYNLHPVIDPAIRVKQAEAKKDWIVIFEIAHAPAIKTMPDVKKIVADIHAQAKKETIWVPGKDEKEKPTEKPEEKKEEQLQKIMDALVNKAEITIAPGIMEQEVNRRMASLLDEVKKLGMNLDQYMQAKGETTDSMRKKAEKEIVEVYTVELLLQQIAENEKITIDDKELEAIFSRMKTDKEREEAKKNAYFYASLMRKQKTLDYLSSL
ncbi:hypothetical protein COU88_03745 [Candidatus Roizmanbacteria bacterium CG10_big_fil_rev_8_21_14_0_10_39_6]|uniref:Uncharacterized protein n=1 Tax=Candidatus Roizmanbacteria bacterium CG10_big_fil_rev_8_21_14_0_10_39_6 TaxID=1974853 RepID=A0A2M8KRY8_9BACT|nr:MAG: hypothetical protein COU88_03745 [Candidatus Roizmanbacteria bacterium CG10_big_fil_rev_8_21_14_0_10_39_6]